jgi:4'-phosphopantetheinyl transferase EntD
MIAADFQLDTPHGACFGLAIPPEVPAGWWSALHPEERRQAGAFGHRRRRSWVAGRVLLRWALTAQGRSLGGPVLSDDRGAPRVDDAVRVSLSHKEDLAVVLVAAEGDRARVGVDLEGLVARRAKIARYVLSPHEQERYGEDWRHVLTVFSLKEALYKALDPFVRRYVRFAEAEVELAEAGAAEFRLTLDGGEGPFEAVGSWRQLDDRWILSTARVRPSASALPRPPPG